MEAIYASHHVSFLFAQPGIGKHNEMFPNFLFSSVADLEEKQKKKKKKNQRKKKKHWQTRSVEILNSGMK